jgi:aminoglycoside phosphotransferase (APT) family kinase protein
MSGIDPDRVRRVLAAWLPARLGADADLSVTLLGAPPTTGFSSETLFVDVEFTSSGERQSRRLAVRFENARPGLLPNANFQLQWDMIHTLATRTNIRVPPPVGFESDRSLLGAAFSVVESVAGRVAPQVPNYNLGGWIFELRAAQRAQLWRDAIETLAQIHRLDWRQGFDFLDQPQRGEPGLKQLLHGTAEWYQWARRGRRHPLIEQAIERLRRDEPRDPPVNILWGDAAAHNVLFGNDLRVAAVLDWEVAGLGPGEADLAWWLFFDEYVSAGFGIPRLEGLPDRQTSIAIYEAAVGRPVRDFEYYELLAHTRNAIMSMRSVLRQVEFGSLDAGTTAITHNPISRMLALRLGAEPPQVGEDYTRYLSAVIGQKTRAPSKQTAAGATSLRDMFRAD